MLFEVYCQCQLTGTTNPSYFNEVTSQFNYVCHFSEVLQEIHTRLFTGGIPITSSTAISENEFFIAGNLMAMSVVQGGPAPCFLAKWVYDYVAFGLSDGLDLNIDDVKSVTLKGNLSKVKLFPLC